VGFLLAIHEHCAKFDRCSGFLHFAQLEHPKRVVHKYIHFDPKQPDQMVVLDHC